MIISNIITNKKLRSTCIVLVAYSGDDAVVVALVRVMLQSKKDASDITIK
jgi:hypothetical protein